MDRSSKLVAVFVCLFALPFAGFGLFALSKAINQILTGRGISSVWLGLIFGLVFSGVGLGLMFLAVFCVKFLKKQQRAQAEHPAEPWLWREDWAEGRIRGNTRSGMIGSWVFAALWNLVSVPTLIFVPQQATKNPVAYLGLIFPAIGVLLLVRAIRLSLAYLEFGKTYFEMTPVPGVIGGELKGMIQARLPHSPEHGIQLRLSCVNRVTSGSGDSRSTSERILWRGEANLSPAQVYPGPSGASIPVNFRIPWDARPTETTSPGNAIVWQLEALADVPGVDYHDVFEVPVFRTQQTPAQPQPGDELGTTPAPASRPAVLTIEVRQTADGTEFFFPAARNKAFSSVTTAFLVVFGAITYFLVHVHAPFIFPLGFGFFTFLLLYITMQMWLGTTRVTIGNGIVSVQDGLLGGGKVKQYRLGEIATISSKINAQQGGGTGTPYYDIELVLGNSRKCTLGRTLRDKQETDWLVEEMRRLVGLQDKAMAAGAS